MKKLRVGIIYGGRSGEHEVSIASAASVLKHLDRARYEPVAIRIEKDGRWIIADRLPTAISAADVIEQARLQAARPIRAGRETVLVAHPAHDIEQAVVTGLCLDVVFPVLHGPYGEDGTVQGLLELANVPYVGAGVMASAVGMDKAAMKVMFAAHGLPVCAWKGFKRSEWNSQQDQVLESLRTLGLPLFVKPVNLGSSVGITKVRTEAELPPAIHHALEFDRKVIVEAAVPEAREIECAVLGNDNPEASLPGEIIPSREFYDYEAKYLDDASRTEIPANVSDEQVKEIQRLAIEAFKAIDAAGMSRVDFLLARASGTIYVNEINTIPGFTTISMYAKMWEASGLSYSALVDRLIQLALERHAEKQQLRTSVT